ncbi:hypothetical protein [Duganella sp. BJB475]|uniref:hypothetical protein n=1 Tax=Duganella sp. BJB475 TaxID=2233914 RepID=UPI000E34F67B|nr:hypothetical protein [Duganella sp. BJB475]
MTAQHTQGRANVVFSEISRMHGSAAVSIGDQPVSSWMPAADARRLAACWNACSSAETYDLEQYGQFWTNGFVMNAALASERDAALKSLTAARALLQEAADTLGAHITGTGDNYDGTNIIPRILAFLKGGA